jgi:hypothetical protein
MTTTDTLNCSTIAKLNDCFRRHPGEGWMITAGLQAKGPIFVLSATSAVRAFDAFTDDNDPEGEHDFGAFEICGERLFWKIDYYDRDLRYGSPDPADPAVTRRVLTIMLASDY